MPFEQAPHRMMDVVPVLPSPTPSDTPIVLVVEDDADIRETTALVLQRAGYRTRVAVDGDAGLRSALDDPPDAAVVDVAMPGMDGIRLTRRLRDLSIPVVLLTARDLPSDVIAGLDAGADDYVTKPFDGAVLAARIRAVLRRPGREVPGHEQVGRFRIDRDAHTVTANGVPMHLSASEFRLLTLLLDHRGQVLSRLQIHDYLWPSSGDDSRVVDTTVQRLRQRLDPQLVRTVRGAGYVIDRP